MYTDGRYDTIVKPTTIQVKEWMELQHLTIVEQIQMKLYRPITNQQEP